MGSWKELCFVSKTFIGYGDEIVAFPVIRNMGEPRYQRHPAHNYIPVAPPVFGTYDDYGGIDLHEGEKEVLEIFQEGVKKGRDMLLSTDVDVSWKGTLKGVVSRHVPAVYPTDLSGISDLQGEPKPSLLFWTFMHRKAYDTLIVMYDEGVLWNTEILQKEAASHYEKQAILQKGAEEKRKWTLEEVQELFVKTSFEQFFYLNHATPLYKVFYPYLKTPLSSKIQGRLVSFLQVFDQCRLIGVHFDRCFEYTADVEVNRHYFMNIFYNLNSDI